MFTERDFADGLTVEERKAARDPKYLDGLVKAFKAAQQSNVEVKVFFNTFGELTLATGVLERIFESTDKLLSKTLGEGNLSTVFELKNGSCVVLGIEPDRKAAVALDLTCLGASPRGRA